jgi:uncharacterized protein
MDKARLFGRGISFPPRVGPNGRLAWAEGEENVRQSIRIILMTEQQERILLPEFGGGLERYLFEPNTVETRHRIQDRISKALAAWEPRISVEQVQIDPDPDDAQAAIATITYRLVATQSTERVSLSVQLGLG